MLQNQNKALKEASPYSAVITREQFLFHEVRTTAQLVSEGLSRDEVITRIVADNLFQYPTEKTIRRMAHTCLRRLDALQNERLVQAIAQQPSEVAKQICLYAMMCQYRLIWDFMLTVIGEKYKKLDSSFSKMDVNVFLLRLQEQDDWVASWSDATITKIRQVIMKILVENEYIDSINTNKLNPVLISPVLEKEIRTDGMEIALPAFNCLS